MTTTAQIIAAATAATARIKAVSADAKAAKDEAFRESALTTFTALKARGVTAEKIAESNKTAGVGYGSPAAVGYHALTGEVLSKPEGDFEDAAPSAQAIQTLVKKVGQKVAKEVVKKSKTQADAVANLTDAVDPEVDITKVLKAALKAVQSAEQARLEGNPLPGDAEPVVESILTALNNVTLGGSPIATVVVSNDEDALTDEDDLVLQ